jgi:hypothetical protein
MGGRAQSFVPERGGLVDPHFCANDPQMDRCRQAVMPRRSNR